MMYTIRRWWRRLWRGAGKASQGAQAGPVVTAFLDGASARECAYRFWHRGTSAELATAHDWPAAVARVEEVVREYVIDLREELAEAGEEED